MLNPKVLFVNHTSTMSGAEGVLADVTVAWRGASAFLFEEGPLAEAMTARGLEVSVSRNGGGLSAVKRDQPLWGAVRLVGRMLGLVGEIAGRARAHDVVYANSQKAFTLAAVAMIFARRPLIWHLHDILDGQHFSPLQRRLQIGLANRFATRVVVPSTATAEAFVSAGGRAGLVRVVPNGVKPPAAGPHPTRADLGLPTGPLIGVFSRLARWKGQHVVLRALAELPGVSCVIAGAPLFGEEAYAAELKALVDELGLADRVRFLGQRSDVPALMRVVDVVVHPSVDAEPFGLTLIEAMSVHTPVVATDAGAASDILDGGRAGTLVPPGDAPALAEAVRDVLANPEGAAERAALAAERAATVYDVERMRAAIAEVIGSAAGGARR